VRTGNHAVNAGDKADRARPVVLGEALFDCFAEGSQVLRGAPFNVAWHLQAFGEAPLLVSRVGNDEPGRRIIATMDRLGMSADGLQTDTAHRTAPQKCS
jgi:fructokinase